MLQAAQDQTIEALEAIRIDKNIDDRMVEERDEMQGCWHELTHSFTNSLSKLKMSQSIYFH